MTLERQLKPTGLAGQEATEGNEDGELPSGCQCRACQVDEQTDERKERIFVPEEEGPPDKRQHEQRERGMVKEFKINEPVPAFKRRPGVSHELSGILSRMLRKQPGERYQDPFQLVKDLSAVRG